MDLVATADALFGPADATAVAVARTGFRALVDNQQVKAVDATTAVAVDATTALAAADETVLMPVLMPMPKAKRVNNSTCTTCNKEISFFSRCSQCHMCGLRSHKHCVGTAPFLNKKGGKATNQPICGKCASV